MAAPTDLGDVARPTCTATRHTAGSYARNLCRCDAGREARRLYLKRHREGRSLPYWVDATGARRRICGLMVMGWTGDHIAAAAGLPTQQVVSQIATERIRINRATAAAICRATATLGGTPGPSVHAKRRALKRGYVPLWAWDDDIDDPAAEPYGLTDDPDVEPAVDEMAVERAVRAVRVGVPLPAGLSRAESAAAAVKLAQAPYRLHDTAIANGMRKNNKWVRQVREAAGVPQVLVSPGRRAA